MNKNAELSEGLEPTSTAFGGFKMFSFVILENYRVYTTDSQHVYKISSICFSDFL